MTDARPTRPGSVALLPSHSKPPTLEQIQRLWDLGRARGRSYSFGLNSKIKEPGFSSVLVIRTEERTTFQLDLPTMIRGQLVTSMRDFVLMETAAFEQGLPLLQPEDERG